MKYRILDGIEEMQREQILKDWRDLLEIYKSKHTEMVHVLNKATREIKEIHPTLTHEDIRDLQHY